MSELPQWQINLLDRLPRPAAVVVIGFGRWFWSDGIPLVTFVGYLIIASFVFAAVTQTGLVGFIVGIPITLFGTAFVLWAVVGILEALGEAYHKLDKSLPHREKKDESA